MEIRNNLISFCDVSAISGIKSLNQKLLSLYDPYKQVLNLTNTQEDFAGGAIYNMISNRKFSLDNSDMDDLFDAIDKYAEQAKPKDETIKTYNLFLPLAEIPQHWSAPTFIIRVPNIIVAYKNRNYVTHHNFEFMKDESRLAMARFIGERIQKMSKESNYTVHMAFMHRAHNPTDIEIKVQCLDALMTTQSRAELAKTIAAYLVEAYGDLYPTMELFIHMHNEMYISNSNPRSRQWQLESIVKIGSVRGGSYSNTVAISDFMKQYVPFSAIFTVNDYGSGGLKKVKFACKYDRDPLPESPIASTEKLQLISSSIYARYYSLILDNLPDRYRTNYSDWEFIIDIFKNKRKYKILFEDFSKNFKTEFGQLWYDNRRNYFSDHGCLYRECLKREGFKTLVYNFYKSYLEQSLYETGCKIGTDHCAMIINMMYNGLFYLGDSDGKADRWWLFIDKYDEVRKGEIYKWRLFVGEPHFIENWIREEFKQIFDSVKTNIELGIASHPKAKTLITKLNDSNFKFLEPAIYKKIIAMVKPKVYNPRFETLRDSYPDVVGTENGILYLNLTADDPQPELCNGYSRFYITKWVNAEYIPYDPDNEYVKLWRKIYSDIFVEPDVCQFVWYMLSTGLDQVCRPMKMLQIVAGGSNGKSVALDNPMYVLRDYATKLRTELLIARSKAGSADENLMDTKGKNLGIITETNEGDELVASRIKEITEYEKRGRGLYAKNESFQSNITIILASNFPLVINEDGGAERRMLFTVAKSIFREKPDPNNPLEKKVNRDYEYLAMKNKDAANALFSILVYERCQLQKLYRSNLDLVPIPTIERETRDYKASQNRLTYFIFTKIVYMYGYSLPGCERRPDISDDEIADYYNQKCVTMTSRIALNQVAQAYIAWLKKYTGKEIALEKAVGKIKESMLAKIMRMEEFCGIRILGENEKKLDMESSFTSS